MITVGIPFYNAENYLEDTIQSILYQSYDDWELILIDDGSTDNSKFVAEKFQKLDSRIRLISDGKNRKLPYRLNQLISESNGEFFARMDADDIMHPNRLEKQIDFLNKNTEFDLVSSGLISINNLNQVQGYRCVAELYSDFHLPKLSYPIVHPSVMARKVWFERNQYSEKYPRAEDFELWTRSIINNDFKMAVLPDLLLFYREEGNLSLDKILNSYKDTLKIYSKYYNNFLDLNIIKLYLKIMIANAFYYTGNLQSLSKHRNKEFDNLELSNYQKIMNSITKSKM